MGCDIKPGGFTEVPAIETDTFARKSSITPYPLSFASCMASSRTSRTLSRGQPNALAIFTVRSGAGLYGVHRNKEPRETEVRGDRVLVEYKQDVDREPKKMALKYSESVLVVGQQLETRQAESVAHSLKR
jgi:hypothetical protein